MKCFYCLLLMLCPYLNMAQAPVLLSISIGDKLPDIAFNNMLNYKNSRAKLSHFKGKLVILDFWATWCSNCLTKFRMLDSMQQANPATLQVLLVNTTGSGDTKAKVDRLFAKINAGHSRPMQLPVVLFDSVLAGYFPHRLLPHYVWLDNDGKVIAITGAEAITVKNIAAALQGKLPPLMVKEDMEDFDAAKPLFTAGNGGNGASLIYRSSFATYIHGLPSSSHTNTIKGGGATHLLYTNMPAVQLLMHAYGTAVNKNRLRISVPDSTNLNYFNKDESWLHANSFTYELITPTGKDSAFLYMQQDLQRYLGLVAKTDTLQTTCFVLTADTGILSRFISSSPVSSNTLFENTNRCICKRQISTLANHLDARLPLPVINETGFIKPVDICLPDWLNIQDIPALQHALKPYGLTLTPAHRKLRNFIIYKKN